MFLAISPFSRAAWLVFIACVLLVLFALFGLHQFRGDGQRNERPGKPIAQSTISPAARAPEEIVDQLVLAWNRGDVERIADLFAPDGILITPTGSELRSPAEIKREIEEQRRDRLGDTTLRHTVDDVSVKNEDTAVVRGKYEIDGVRVLFGLTTTAGGSYVFRQTKANGRWMISKADLELD